MEQSQIVKAIKQDEWLQFHGEESLSEADASRYLSDFKAWINSILPADKAAFFHKMMRFPVYTNELVKAISDEISKVYESQNSSFTYEFSNPKDEADFISYLQEINFSSEWRDQSKAAMIKNISALIVIDMPESAEETKPYFYVVPSNTVHRIDLSDKGEVLEVILRQGDNKMLYIDQERYAMFTKVEREWVFTSEAFHELGYTPVCTFWQDSIKSSQPFVKKSPITPALSNLDKLLRNVIFRDMAEMDGAFPITVTWDSDCEYAIDTPDGKIECCEGILNLASGVVACPACSSSQWLGPGTLLKVKAPRNKEDPNNLEAVHRMGAEVDTLEFLNKRIDGLWDEIFYDCTGWGGEGIDKQAMNDKQVRGNFESKQNVLLNVAKNLQVSRTFVVTTMAKLRYTSFLTASSNYGTKFYLQTATEAQSEYKEAKASGVPNYLLSYKRSQVDMINTRGNDNDGMMLNILKHLEPWIDLSLSECKELGFNESYPELFNLKADFSRLILRFESEYGSIIEFGRLLDFKIKIERITQKLFEYVKDNPIARSTATNDQSRLAGGVS